MKNKMMLMLLGLAMVSSQVSFAQSEVGQGGDPNELSEFKGRNGELIPSWYSVKKDLIEGFNLNQHFKLQLPELNLAQFKLKTLEVLNTTSVEFKDERIVINGVARVCKNYIDTSSRTRIQCDSSAYVNEMKNHTSEDLYKLIAHEYFALAGFEPNTYGLSDYFISSQISKSIQEVKIKRWAVATSPRSNIRVGSVVNFFYLGSVAREVGKVVNIYEDGKVEVSSASAGGNTFKNITSLGIEIDSKCIEDICVGDQAKYWHIGEFRVVTEKIHAVFDNGYVQLDNALRKISKISKVSE